MNKKEVESKEENHSKLEQDLKRELRVNELSKETKNNLVSRIIIAVCIVVLILPCILLGDYFLFALTLLLSLITTHEIAKAPQSFWLDEILNAHTQALADGITDYIDSCTMMQKYGSSLYLIDGPSENIKITTPEDFYTMRAILEAKENAQIYGVEEYEKI